MNKRRAKEAIRNALHPSFRVNPNQISMVMLLDDTVKIAELRAEVQAIQNQSQMYCDQIDAASDQREIDQVLNTCRFP